MRKKALSYLTRTVITLCVVEMTMTRSRLVNICAIKVVHYIHCKDVTLLGYVIMGDHYRQPTPLYLVFYRYNEAVYSGID